MVRRDGNRVCAHHAQGDGLLILRGHHLLDAVQFPVDGADGIAYLHVLDLLVAVPRRDERPRAETDVFPQRDVRITFTGNANPMKRQRGARVSAFVHTRALASNRQVGARRSAAEHVERPVVAVDLRHVSEVGDVGVAVCENAAGERLDLGEEAGLPVCAGVADGEGMGLNA